MLDKQSSSRNNISNLKLKKMKGLAIFGISGFIALSINLTVFMIFLKFVPPYIASIFAFIFAVSFNFFFHGKFLWQSVPSFRKYKYFVSGYSISLMINIIFVYTFASSFAHPVISQIIGGLLGVIINYFVSKHSFKKKV
jgi:putative flippase GtrA